MEDYVRIVRNRVGFRNNHRIQKDDMMYIGFYEWLPFWEIMMHAIKERC